MIWKEIELIIKYLEYLNKQLRLSIYKKIKYFLKLDYPHKFCDLYHVAPEKAEPVSRRSINVAENSRNR